MNKIVFKKGDIVTFVTRNYSRLVEPKKNTPYTLTYSARSYDGDRDFGYWHVAENVSIWIAENEMAIYNGKIKKTKPTKEKCIVFGTNDVIKEWEGYKLPKATPLSKKALIEAGNVESSRNPIGSIGSKEFGIIKSKRTFGCELESIASNNLSGRIGKYLLPSNFGWGGDGSIRTTGHEVGIEYKTCPLFGKKGEETLITSCQLLRDTEHKVHTSCGTHCHIGIPEALGDTSELVQKKLKNLVLMYSVFEPVILSLLPEDRRNNNYCTRISDRYAVFKDIKTLQKNDFSREKCFDTFWYNTKNKEHLKRAKSNRAVRNRDGINFNSISFRGTLEVRFHQGTLDGVELVHWIALHSAIVDHVMSGKIDQKAIIEYKKVEDVKELLDKLLELLSPSLDESTIAYTLARFKKYKKLNPKDGYITRRFVQDPDIADDFM